MNTDVKQLFTYFEKHDIISRFNILVRRMLALLFYLIYHGLLSFLEIVGAQNNISRFPALIIIKKSAEIFIFR